MNTAHRYQRALLWDVDGVLVDSEPLHIAKLKEVSKKYGLDLKDTYMTTRQQFRVPNAQGELQKVEMQLGGAGDKNIYWWAYSEYLRISNLPCDTNGTPESKGFISQATWLKELLAFYKAHANDETSAYKLYPRDNMCEMVDALCAQGTLQGVVTSGIPEQVRTNLKVLGADASGKERSGSFTFVLDADSVKQSKPNPEGYLIGIKKLSDMTDTPLAVVVIEDSKPGVIAALLAGAACVHFLLPGQTAMSADDFEAAGLGDAAITRYRCATKGLEAERQADKLFEEMEAGILPTVENAIRPRRAPKQERTLGL
ncbi:MAG: HAD family phosphatase [Alphaproteobacteria bacterium]|nr:HAD family phosphatase [Alphaproteobacteria bacterium]